MRRRYLYLLPALLLLCARPAFAAPPRMSIYHFDVNVGDATLILSPDGRGVLIDGGNTGRGNDPIKEFLDRARAGGHLTSLDYVIATHYDADHVGGLDEVLNGGWYPEIHVLDRGNSFLPRFDQEYVRNRCSSITNVNQAQQLAPWGTAPASSCSRKASCSLVEYFQAAESGGKRKEIQPGDTLTLDHGIEIVALVVNAEDIDGDTVDVHFSGRRNDCAANDLSVGLLVKYGDFRYLIAGDLTGDRSRDVAEVEHLIEDDARNVDVYHVNHHGSKTSSEEDFMEAIHPTVAVVSNGNKYGHPHEDVINDRILNLDPPPAVYLTNRNPQRRAWKEDEDAIADQDPEGYDGIIELAVWKRSYRVFRWRDGDRLDRGDKYFIMRRD